MEREREREREMAMAMAKGDIMKRIIIKVFSQEVASTYHNTDENSMTLLSHQELEFKSNTPRHIQLLMANLARYINEERDN